MLSASSLCVYNLNTICAFSVVVLLLPCRPRLCFASCFIVIAAVVVIQLKSIQTVLFKKKIKSNLFWWLNFILFLRSISFRKKGASTEWRTNDSGRRIYTIHCCIYEYTSNTNIYCLYTMRNLSPGQRSIYAIYGQMLSWIFLSHHIQQLYVSHY